MQDKYNNMGIKIWKNDNLKKNSDANIEITKAWNTGAIFKGKNNEILIEETGKQVA